MNKQTKYILTTVWILLSRSYDAYCTNQLTPDLTKEANPLVTIGGISSWATLLSLLGVLTLYTLYAYYLSTFRPMNLLPKEKGYSFNRFVAYLYLGKKANWTSIFYQLPNSCGRFNHYIGEVLTRFLVYAGVVSTTMWLLINHTEFYKTMHSATLIYTILIAGCLAIGYLWNKSLYRRYRQNIG